MDTVEWGTRDGSRARGLTRWARRWRTPIAWWLAGGGAALAVAAEVLPWTSTPPGNPYYERIVDGSQLSLPSLTGNTGLTTLDATSVLVYHLVWLVLLALAGLMLTGPLAARRAVAGAALGVAVAQAMLLAGDIRWILTSGATVSPGQNGTLTLATGRSSGVGPGVLCAGLGVGLIVAVAVLSLRRPTPVTPALVDPALVDPALVDPALIDPALVAPAVGAPVRPDQLDLLDEPVDLTVTAADPVESDIGMSDRYRGR